MCAEAVADYEQKKQALVRHHLALIKSNVDSNALLKTMLYDATTRITAGSGFGFNVALVLMSKKRSNGHFGFYAKAPISDESIPGVLAETGGRPLIDELTKQKDYERESQQVLTNARGIHIPYNADSVINQGWERRTNCLLPHNDPAYAAIDRHIAVVHDHDWVAAMPFRTQNSHFIYGFMVVANPYTHEPFEAHKAELEDYWFSTAAPFMLKASSYHMLLGFDQVDAKRREEVRVDEEDICEFLGI